ncbi:unnamed protein product [Paramecium sonneborni]|uniref:Uncharacterized protein n=1 Tax=Paramecium sonneborni TaxID=65129 RepID=A0A8S1QP38_9CILI|nr:unnamed protein product [Paramecium sonneborni]
MLPTQPIFQNNIQLNTDKKLKPKKNKQESEYKIFEKKRKQLHGIFIELFKLFGKFAIKRNNLTIDEAEKFGSRFQSVENFIFLKLQSTFRKQIAVSISNILCVFQNDQYLEKLIKYLMEKAKKKRAKNNKSKGKLLGQLSIDKEEDIRQQLILIIEKLYQLYISKDD